MGGCQDEPSIRLLRPVGGSLNKGIGIVQNNGTLKRKVKIANTAGC